MSRKYTKYVIIIFISLVFSNCTTLIKTYNLPNNENKGSILFVRINTIGEKLLNTYALVNLINVETNDVIIGKYAYNGYSFFDHLSPGTYKIYSLIFLSKLGVENIELFKYSKDFTVENYHTYVIEQYELKQSFKNSNEINKIMEVKIQKSEDTAIEKSLTEISNFINSINAGWSTELKPMINILDQVQINYIYTIDPTILGKN